MHQYAGGTRIRRFSHSAPHPKPACAWRVRGLDRHGVAPGFELFKYDKGLDRFCGDAPDAYLDRLIPFAYATHSGSYYALWRCDDRTDLATLPVVFSGDEGDLCTEACNLRELFRLLAAEPDDPEDRARLASHARGITRGCNGTSGSRRPTARRTSTGRSWPSTPGGSSSGSRSSPPKTFSKMCSAHSTWTYPRHGRRRPAHPSAGATPIGHETPVPPMPQ
ncbi:hypothetical protein ACFC5Z_38615 [Streptomyces sp. NPDC056004]|uniref:hypothetical protein n=1 Tax=Streptomyces sp. NPDC056004 TaxID=3345677 RepID=UPI0035DB6DE2